MKHSNLRFVLVGAAMILAAGAALALKPSPAQQDREDLDREKIIPRAFGDWTVDPNVVPIPPTPDVQANLDRLYDQIVSRTCVNAPGERVMLTIAYGGDQSDALRARRQEACYAAWGFEIRSVFHDRLRIHERSIPITRFLAVRGPRSEPVTYWFTMGDRVVLGRLERLMVQLKFGLSGRIPDGMLVRTSSISTRPARAFQHHEEFISALLAAVREGDVHRLAGSLPATGAFPSGASTALSSMRIATAAQETVRQRFAVDRVMEQLEDIYAGLGLARPLPGIEANQCVAGGGVRGPADLKGMGYG